MKRDLAARPDVDPITLEIIRGAMSLIDRGPGFAEADAVWRAGAAPHQEAPTGRS